MMAQGEGGIKLWTMLTTIYAIAAARSLAKLGANPCFV